MNFKEIKSQIKKEKLFDDQLIECAKNNFNKGRLSALKDEEEFIKNFQTNCICEKCGRLDSLHRKRLSQIQKEIQEIGQ